MGCAISCLTNQVPEAVADFIDRITSRWAFTQLVPAHFSAPAKAKPEDLQAAFAFAYQLAGRTPAPVAKGKAREAKDPLSSLLAALLPVAPRAKLKPVRYTESDMKVLDAVNKLIVSAGVAQK